MSYMPSRLNDFSIASLTLSESSFSVGRVQSHGTTRTSRRISPLPLHHLHFGSGSMRIGTVVKP